MDSRIVERESAKRFPDMAGVACGLLLLGMVFLAGATAFAEVTIAREGEQLKGITMKTATGEIHIKRANWGNTTLKTASGKVMAVTDPFMYNAYVKRPGQKSVGGYWNKPEVFDTWKVEQVKAADKPGVDIVKIAAQMPDIPLRKEITIALDPRENAAYVFSRVTALEDINLDIDQQSMWFSKVDLYDFSADGKTLRAEDDRRIYFSRWILVHQPARDVSVAVVGVRQDRKRGIVGSVHFRVNPKQNGAGVAWHKFRGPMKKGEAHTQQYVLVWGDGDLRVKVAAMAKQAESGAVDSMIYVPTGK